MLNWVFHVLLDISTCHFHLDHVFSRPYPLSHSVHVVTSLTDNSCVIKYHCCLQSAFRFLIVESVFIVTPSSSLRNVIFFFLSFFSAYFPSSSLCLSFFLFLFVLSYYISSSLPFCIIYFFPSFFPPLSVFPVVFLFPSFRCDWNFFLHVKSHTVGG
jgi:hypothetical protein